MPKGDPDHREAVRGDSSKWHLINAGRRSHDAVRSECGLWFIKVDSSIKPASAVEPEPTWRCQRCFRAEG